MNQSTPPSVQIYQSREEEAGRRPPSDSETIVYTRNLTKEFGEERVVDNISLEIPRGKIMGFIGPSGSGKTTTVRLLLGIYAPTEGEVIVLGRPPAKFRRQERERIGYMPQLFVLYPALTVWENLNFAASLYGVPWRRHKRLRELLDLVELEGHERKVVRDISGGMQRRLSLAAALVHDPELIFLDEPTAGIDPVLRRKFWDYFRQLQERGHTLFITTQYVNEAAYCDYVAIMAEGRLLMVETPEGLRRRASRGDMVDLKPQQGLTLENLAALETQPDVIGDIRPMKDGIYRITVEDASVAIPRLLDWCEEQGIEVESVREYLLPFDDVFVRLIEEETDNA